MRLSKMQELIIIEILAFVILFGVFIDKYFQHPSNILATSSSEAFLLTSEEIDSDSSTKTKKDYIKWIDFNVTKEAMQDAYNYDVETHGQDIHLDWIALLSYQACKNGGDFSRYKSGDMNEIAQKLINGEENIETLTKDMQHYTYYYEAYGAVLGGLVGDYEVETVKNEQTGETVWEQKYGLKGFLPLAKNFPYSDYDDFGVSRSYGYKRQHLGHDMMGQVGTPVVAVESGYVEAMGWNQYGGWRLGIRSFDKKRYYYYAHLRQNFPYNKSLKEGSIVTAGDIVGYLGHTGYSAPENVNNIDTPHLHFGLQIIFDESQKEGNNEIWVSCYELTRFLYQNRSEAAKDEESKEWIRTINIKDSAVDEWETARLSD